MIKSTLMKKTLIVFLGLFLFVGCTAQQARRELIIVSFSGSGYELGLQHGKELKNEIAEIVSAWKKNTSISLEKDADLVLKEFFEYAEFDLAIKTWTPELYEEIKGIAEGADQKLKDVLVLNLLDEFWVYVDNLNNHHCSAMAVPAKNGNPGYISQNMDLENYTDGFQVLMRLNRTENRPEQLILTHPGLIALNGLNEKGIGVCVNTLMQLKASSSGLPVAFVIRKIINSTDKKEVLNFIQEVNHASGQNYIIGIQGEVYDFEASATKVVRYNPNNENGSVYHTNHPVVNDDLKPWFAAYDPSLEDDLKPNNTSTYLRFSAVESRLATSPEISDVLIKEALRSKDNRMYPVCRSHTEDGRVFTFASVVMTISMKPNMQVLAGPPDETEYETFEFSTE
jgi:predicted choloylglycine hydrolase